MVIAQFLERLAGACQPDRIFVLMPKAECSAQCSELNDVFAATALTLVIPAKAGIQLKMTCAAHDIKALSASHDAFKLDSGLRRNDE